MEPGMMPKLQFLFIVLLMIAGVAKTHAGNIILNWDASASTNAAGYNVYYGTNSGNYPYKINVGNATTITISNLSAGVTYYLAATAYDASGSESAYSSEISYLVSGILTMTPGTSPGSPALIQFPVEPGHWYEVQATTNLQNWSSIWQSGVMASNVWTQFTDPDTGSFASRFYRLVIH